MSDDAGQAVARVVDSDRRRRAVRQLLFVVAGSHTGAFVGSIVPSSRLGLPADVFSLLLVAVLFTLLFVVDAKWETIDSRWQQLKNYSSRSAAPCSTSGPAFTDGRVTTSSLESS